MKVRLENSGYAQPVQKIKISSTVCSAGLYSDREKLAGGGRDFAIKYLSQIPLLGTVV